MCAAFNDVHKRTSISQLLNPSPLANSPHEGSPSSSSRAQDVPSAPPQNGGNEHSDGSTPGSSFPLRSASWGLGQGPKRTDGPDPSRPYHYTPFSEGVSSDTRAGGPKDNAGNITGPSGAWPALHEMPNMAYGTPVLAPMYSDERTALSGDFGSGPNSSRPPPVTLLYYSQLRPGNYNQVYPHEQSTGGGHSQDWQTAERASTRLVARGTVNEAPSAQQHRYAMPPGFYAPLGAMIFQQGPPPVPQPPPKAPKRRAAENEDITPGPKSKKAKSKAKSAADGAAAGSDTGTSKRGYNAKKRNEAAQIAAQNAQLMPSVSYSQSSNEQGEKRPDAKTMRIVQDASSHPEASGPLHPELQFARCMSNRYKNEQFPRCVSCTRRWAGDTCRFQGIRFFLKDNNRNIVGISFVENQKPDAPAMTFPDVWNVPLQAVHIRRTKRAIAHALLPILQQELEHLRTPEIIRRPRENEVRATCDTCMTSLFSSSWMCRLCGREACAECFEQVKDLTNGNPEAPEAEVIALQIKREKHSHSNPFFLSCTRRNEHQSKDFSPMSRFCKAELAEAINEMEALIRTSDIDALPGIGAIDPALQGPSTQTSQINGTSPFARFLNGHVPEPAITSDSVPSNNAQIDPALLSSIAVADIPCHTPKYFTNEELTEEVFRPLWQKGEPLVVTGLLPKFKIKWTPEYFIEKYESQACLILECQTDVNKRITVGEFFSWFGKYDGRTECWKLKDWPPSTDFKTAFPELFEDFSRAVPVPNYVRRDGTLNVASHFPLNTVAPDLGPKMYNAMASFESAGSKGSTRLHMDMADALNIMTFASPTPDGQPGTAAWDLFRAEDSDKIRQFLKKKFKGAFQHDPIHSQQCYLDTTLRHELWTEFGVKSYRVYQKPGEAVFIPAGCAHQVCNLADCVKVAVDFVSPENIARCEKLTMEFREQNQSMVWKEDVLQLRTMMWFAWLSCCLQEKGMA